ncbi:Gamma-aminobutyric acid receptor alpha-like [Gryllus bimaculatus]|nr:Gamma-aminobutyric acid receptor alpha-like [Gryllus bimaculatus]
MALRALLALLALLAAAGPCAAHAMLRDYRSLQRNVTYLLDALLSPSRYDKRIRPGLGGPPVVVTVNMLIKSMGPVSETDEEYVMDCYFRQTWFDKRLTFHFPGMETFSMPWLFLERVWKPDTFFMNGKKSHLHRITVPNKFLRLGQDGYLVYSMRLTIKASCPMHLRKFPLDTQKCPLLIGSCEWQRLQGKRFERVSGVRVF